MSEFEHPPSRRDFLKTLPAALSALSLNSTSPLGALDAFSKEGSLHALIPVPDAAARVWWEVWQTVLAQFYTEDEEANLSLPSLDQVRALSDAIYNSKDSIECPMSAQEIVDFQRALARNRDNVVRELTEYGPTWSKYAKKYFVPNRSYLHARKQHLNSSAKRFVWEQESAFCRDYLEGVDSFGLYQKGFKERLTGVYGLIKTLPDRSVKEIINRLTSNGDLPKQRLIDRGIKSTKEELERLNRPLYQQVRGWRNMQALDQLLILEETELKKALVTKRLESLQLET